MTIILSEAMSQGIAGPGTPTDPARAKELLEELYQLYNIDLLQPLRSCILGIHLVTEFIEHKLNQGVEESTLFESLIAWKTRNDVDRATKATSTEDLQDSETTNERPHCELILYQCICDLHVTWLPEYYYFF